MAQIGKEKREIEIQPLETPTKAPDTTPEPVKEPVKV
jgi:hypothetical protein